jgi:hexosaminidase
MIHIIPRPAHIEEVLGFFHLRSEVRILADEANRPNAEYLHELLAPPTGFQMEISTGKVPAENAIVLCLDPALPVLSDEGYRLVVQPEVVILCAKTTTGIFYGIQSLRQLLPIDVENRAPVNMEWCIPCVIIEDQPRFSWRGFMLDEGRYFHGRETVLQLLELMALQKLNVFHWHLTEDQGWRIEIKKYPRLTEVGAHRPGTRRSMLSKKHDGIPHEGFYTQEQIREIVAFAASRHITIMPEIEMPGHSLAALAAYPNLSCTGGPFEVATGSGIQTDIYCAGKEATFTFLQDILDEILELFPSPIIHIGGDEAPKVRWKKCPDCQRRIRVEGLKDENALQAWFTDRINKYLESKGRRLMGWNQILEDGLASSAIIHYWLGNKKLLVKAINEDHRQVVMSTYLDTYLDHGYNLMPLSRAYHYEPVPAGLEGYNFNSVIGLEFPLWGEWLPNRARLDYQAWPRLSALAETGWTPRECKDFIDFRHRLPSFLERLDHFDVRYASLVEAEPPKWKRLFALLTIAQAQKKVAGHEQKAQFASNV